ncbi:uncharacterized protein LOC144342961, partial [Saccoglossus kowalevskii]
NDEYLAKVLYLQLDNCFRENKNRFLLSLMKLMVEIYVYLEETVTASYTPPIKSRGLLKKNYNIKDWLLPHITGKMQGHSKPHNFHFHKVGGRAYMQYTLCTDKWQPTTIYANGDQVPSLICLK